MKLKVGTFQKGSMNPVAKSGINAISPDFTLLSPTLEPSKPTPALIVRGEKVSAERVT
jgi:hypothetical protein